MTIDRGFDALLLASLICLAGLGVGRAVMLYRRGVRVVVIERERSPAQALGDLGQVVCLLVWAYEVVAHTWPLSGGLAPAWLETRLIDAPWVHAAGALTVVGALALYAAALRAFGDSWRLGIDRRRAGALVTEGIFAYTRNPIYLSLDLFLAGTCLMQCRLIFVLLAVVNAAWFHNLVRREEHFLSEAYGEAYARYLARVGRYLRWR